MAHKRNVRRGTTAKAERKAKVEARAHKRHQDRLMDDIILSGAN